MSTDYRQLVRTVPRDEFINQNPHPFLVGLAALNPPEKLHRATMRFELPLDEPTRTGVPRPVVLSPAGSTMIYAVRKTGSTFPDMITVGRTANNDLVLSDISVSKFHAYFRAQGESMEVSDAGSKNGTYVRGVRLPERGSGTAVSSGDEVRFGGVTFLFLDAGALWDRLRR